MMHFKHRWSQWEYLRDGLFHRKCKCGAGELRQGCDIGEHKFEKWGEPYSPNTILYQLRQTRTCTLCGLSEDREVTA